MTWKIISFATEYEVSVQGNVRSSKSGKQRILKPWKNNDGYLCIKLNSKIYMVHRVVAIVFLSNPNNKRTVNHKNGYKTDNRIENLEWATHSENHLHAFRELGRKNNFQTNHPRPHLGKLGADNPNSKTVSQYTKEGIFIANFVGLSEASRITGVNIGDISSCCSGRYKSAGGFVWKL